MLRREQDRSCFFVSRPSCDDETRLRGPAAMISKLLDAVVFADVKVPSIARCVPGVVWIFHGNQFGGSTSNWKLLHSLISHRRACVPLGMEGKQKPIVVVDETWINFLLHRLRLAGEIGSDIGNLDWLAFFVLSLKGHFICLGFPRPSARDIHSWKLRSPCVTDRVNLTE